MQFSKQVKVTGLFYLALASAVTGLAAKHFPQASASTITPVFYQTLDHYELFEGDQYLTLKQDAATEPEVKLFFTPYCKPCAVVHTPLKNITKRAGLKFIEVPVNFGAIGKDIQESVYTAESQGISEKFMAELLGDIHHKRNANPKSREDLAALIERCGGDATKYRAGCEQARSYAENLDTLAKQYSINATPTIVVNGNKQINLQNLRSLAELEFVIMSLSRNTGAGS